MVDINPQLMLDQVKARIECTTNSRHRDQLSQILAHLTGEVEYSVDQLMDSYAVAEPSYVQWSSGVDCGPKTRQGIRDNYLMAVEAKIMFMEYDIERIVVDDRAVVTDGWETAVWPREFSGLHESAPSGPYLKRFRMLIIWPFTDDGLLTGEEFYFSGLEGEAGLRLLAEEEVPEGYYLQPGFRLGSVPTD